ncbi:MAG: energy transducer TonB [Candidatus Rokuibacteriota bacterium]
MNDGGGTAPLEPSPIETRGRSALADVTGPDDASGIGVAASPDLGSTRPPPGDGGSGEAGAGQQLARRAPGSEDGEAPQAVYTEYLSRLRQRLHEALRYPPAARRRGLTGAVTIELTILPSGLISDVSVVASSSHPLLDDAAVETVRELRAQPFPASLPPRTLRVRLPVVFQLE